MAGLVLGACGRTGGATTRLGPAEDEVERLVGRIVEELELEVAAEDRFGVARPCELATAGDGASNAMSVRGPLPAVDDPLGRASAVLLEADYELVDSDLEDGVFGRRDGIRITVTRDEPTRQLLIDASTGCRPVGD